jgi:hypothetical protein
MNDNDNANAYHAEMGPVPNNSPTTTRQKKQISLIQTMAKMTVADAEEDSLRTRIAEALSLLQRQRS